VVKLYDRKNALVAADMLNDKLIPFFGGHEFPSGESVAIAVLSIAVTESTTSISSI
jgi:hypothetical protein